MIYEMTVQVRVSNIEEGQRWYEVLLNRGPDFVPHHGFAEWELLPGCWLQLAEGEPTVGSGPIRLGVKNIEIERDKLINILDVEPFEIFNREEVPVKWATFQDPWGNRLGFFEYRDKKEMANRIEEVLGQPDRLV
ncbi:hypothetical protein HNQ94_001154 [Salirhabdus euzebyi]|uniref:Ornithine monooxygenase n=1 Tax=Salirhabdus euzebyi TaxID=394506 RepID=A0A841Q363_9BACI|nr:VOC family protein [Salirhabdus euzebyi]MBB6452708.1 hypothetical protein [Salirhabdus euzebyi]